jgi:hypothetical protein
MMMGKRARNERLKLTATFLNNIAFAAVTAAAALLVYKLFAMTIFEIIIRLEDLSFLEMADRVSGVIGSLLLAVFLHFFARHILTGLQD